MTQDKVYSISDLQQIFKNTGASSWQELSHFIKTKGDQLWHITSEEADQMSKDIDKLAQKGESFTDDPQKIYEMVTMKDSSTDHTGNKGGQQSTQKQQTQDSYQEKQSKTENKEHGSQSIWDKLFGMFK